MEPKIINLPKINDNRGNLSFIQENFQLPFKIARTFWIYDVPGGEVRGGHSFRTSQEFIIAISGSFDVILDRGKEKKSYYLNRSFNGLYVPAGTWRHMENFSTNSVALVLSSTYYDENDYVRDYNEFLNFLASASFNKKQTFVFREKKLLLVNPKLSSVFDCSIINLEIIHQDKGNITVVENQKSFPFTTERVYYLYDIPGGESRGGHAHFNLHQIIIAVSGSFDVILNDGKIGRSVSLNRPNYGLYIFPGIWRELINFSSGSVCLVLASEKYSETDYLRDYNDYKMFKNDSSII